MLVGLTGKRQRTHAAIGVAGLQIDKIAGAQLLLRIVEGVQAFVEDTGRQRVVFRDREPFLIRVVHEVAFGDLLAQIEIGEEVVGGQALEIFTQRGGQRGFLLAPLPLVKHSGQSRSRMCTDHTCGTGFSQRLLRC